jgi:hypothetical protein
MMAALGMAAMSGTQAIGSFGSAYSQAQARRAQGDYESKMYELNSRLASLQAEDALRRGGKEAAAHKQKVKQMIGTQRVNLAAQGIEIDEGTALQIQEEAAYMGEIDAMTIKNNAWREAWGYRVQGSQLMAQSQISGIAGRAEAKNTLLTGGMNALGYGIQTGYYAKDIKFRSTDTSGGGGNRTVGGPSSRTYPVA